jgi:hypothetical protein
MLSKNPFVRYDHFFPKCLGEQTIPFFNGLQNKQVSAVWSHPGWSDLFLFPLPQTKPGSTGSAEPFTAGVDRWLSVSAILEA